MRRGTPSSIPKEGGKIFLSQSTGNTYDVFFSTTKDREDTIKDQRKRMYQVGGK